MVRAHCYHLSQSMEPKRPAGLYALLVSVALSCAPPPTRICLLVEWPQSHAEPVYFCPRIGDQVTIRRESSAPGAFALITLTGVEYAGEDVVCRTRHQP